MSNIISHPSIKIFSLLSLIIITLMSVSIIVYATFNIHKGALNAQLMSMKQVIKVAANEQIRQIKKEALTMGQAISQYRTFKKTFSHYQKTGSSAALEKQLNEPFISGYIFAGTLELVWLRSYDLNFQLITESSAALPEALQSLPGSIHHFLTQRQGNARMQNYGALWQSSTGTPYYSVFIAIGGLRPRGYLEVVINPLFNLPRIEDMIQMPIIITPQKNGTNSKAKLIQNNEHYMPVSYWLNDADNKPAIQIIALVDIAQFASQTNKTIWQSIIVLILLTGSVLFLMLWLLNHYLLHPLNIMVSRLEVYKTDSSVSIPGKGLLELQILAKAFNRLLGRLEKQHKELKQLSILDGLTGIANRRCFDDYLQQQWQLAKQKKQIISLLLIDIDHFKLYNDHYGHQQGDSCLRQVAEIIDNELQNINDLAARYGGEEFAVILPDSSKNNAQKVAERIMKSLDKQQLVHKKSPTTPCVSISIGIAECNRSEANDDNESSLIKQADQALYQAKEQGRNRLFIMHQEK